jgi:hypothetical protein
VKEMGAMSKEKTSLDMNRFCLPGIWLTLIGHKAHGALQCFKTVI